MEEYCHDLCDESILDLGVPDDRAAGSWKVGRRGFKSLLCALAPTLSFAWFIFLVLVKFVVLFTLQTVSHLRKLCQTLVNPLANGLVFWTLLHELLCILVGRFWLFLGIALSSSFDVF